MTADATARRSRRSILAAVLGAAAASIAGAIVRPGRADATGATTFTSTLANGPALYAANTAATSVNAFAEAVQASNASTSDNNNAVSAIATGTSGFTQGLYAEIASNAGNGVYGFAGSATGYTGGVSGESDSSGGVGVWGYSGFDSTGTMGITGPDDPGPIGKTGVLGVATQPNAATRGVIGRVVSTQGEGVVGVAGSVGYPTVYGNIGVHGLAAGRGVFGQALGGGTGVHGVGKHGLGVRADAKDGTALKATANDPSGVALRAIGRVKYDDAAGVLVIPAGHAPGYLIAVTPGVQMNMNTTAIMVSFMSPPAPSSAYISKAWVVTPTQFNIAFSEALSFSGPVTIAWHVFG